MRGELCQFTNPCCKQSRRQGRKILWNMISAIRSNRVLCQSRGCIGLLKFDLILEFRYTRKTPKVLGKQIFDDGVRCFYSDFLLQRQYRMIDKNRYNVIDELGTVIHQMRRLRFYLCPCSAHWVLHRKKLYSVLPRMLLLITNVSSTTKVALQHIVSVRRIPTASALLMPLPPDIKYLFTKLRIGRTVK